MKKTLILMAAAASVVLTGCTESDISSDTSLAKESAPSAIEFSASTGNAGVTRAEVPQQYEKGAIGNTDGDFTKSLKHARFGVFAYHTTSGVYNPATPTELVPNFMYNQELKYGTESGPDAWVYDPVKYWPNGVDAANAVNNPSNTATEKNTNQKLSFFAVAPFITTPTQDYTGTVPAALTTAYVKTNGAANGINAMTTNAFTGNVWVKYLMPKAYENEAVDLLWGVRGQKNYSETDGNNNTVDKLGDNYNINLTKQTVDEKVKFLFKHALTKIAGQTVTEENVSETPGVNDKIGFKIVADVDVNTEATAGDHDNQAAYFGSNFEKSKTLITLKSIKIQDGKTATNDDETSVTGITESGIYNSGWFNIETGTWDKQESTDNGSTISIVAKSDNANQSSYEDTDYSINPAIREATDYTKSDGEGPKKLAAGGVTWDGSMQPTGIYTEPVPVFAKENIPGIMLIPGATGQDIYITVDYLVRTADPNLSNGFTVVEQVISNKVSLASLQPNKYYTIIMHLGLTSVKFEAVVADWVTNNATEFNEDGSVVNPGSATENESHIWLPSNVITSQNITINLPADATSSSVTLNSMAEGAYTSSNTTVIASGTVLSTETGHKTLSIGGLTANESTTDPQTTVVTITDAAPKVYTITIIQAIKP